MKTPNSPLGQLTQNDRQAALRQAHERPPLDLGDNTAFLHQFAFQADPASIEALINRIGNYADAGERSFALGELDHCPCKLEKHTEFATFTVAHLQGCGHARDAGFHDLVPIEPASVLCDVLVVFHENAASLLKAASTQIRPVGGTLRGEMQVHTTLLPDQTGRQRFDLLAAKARGHELGRRVQRLLEMEQYRVLTLMGLETAKQIGPALDALEKRLDTLVIASADKTTGEGDPETLLRQLSQLATELNALRAASRFRFSASKAYYDIVLGRLESLDECKAGDLQTLTGFVRARLDPAIATIKSVGVRQETLSREIVNALSLLRTRIDVELNRSNHQSLESMNERHRRQLRISQSVEGLSIVAISYYAVGLVSYLFKAAEKHDMLPVSAATATGLSVPVVVLLVAVFLRMLRNGWTSGRDETIARF